MIFSRWRLIAAMVVCVSFSAGHAAAQNVCSNSVQGQVAFDGKNAKTWTPANLQALCRGAEGSIEPGKCFARVMGGTVSYGGGTSWVPANALRLCAGATDSNARISCFEGKLTLGWSAAIDACGGAAVASAVPPQAPIARAPQIQRSLPSVILPTAPAAPAVSCAPNSKDCDGDGAEAQEYGGNDCDDRDPRRYPGGNEVADAVNLDEDCNAATYGRRDSDADGYDDVNACNVGPNGARYCGSDCDDGNASVHPTQIDVLNDRDDNCDGRKDEDQTPADLRRLMNN